MKIKKLIKYSVLIFFLLLFTNNVYASSQKIGIDNGKNIKQDIRIYYTENLEDIGIRVDKDTYNNLNSSDKEDITTKLEAYIYKNKIKPIESISDVSTSDNFFNPNKKGFYLIVFDKKNFDGKVLESKPILIYYDGSYQNIKVKSEVTDSDKLKEIEVVLEWHNNMPLMDRVKVGIYDSDGNLLGEVWLSKDNNWRHIFKNLDPLKSYSIWPSFDKNIIFTIRRVGNTFYIKNLPLDDLPDIYIPVPDNPDIKPDPSNPDGKPDETSDKKPDNNIDGNSDGEIPNVDENPKNDINDTENKGEISSASKVKKSKKLPQTGLLWWPLAILVGLSLFFFLLSLRREDE